MDKDLSVAELLEKYPYLKKLSNYLFLSKSDYDRYLLAEKIKYNEAKEISVTLLKDLFLKAEYYSFVENLFNDETASLNISTILGGDTYGRLTITKVELLQVASELLAKEKNPFISEKLAILKAQISGQKFYENNQNQEFKVKIEGTEYVFKIKDFLDFLSLDTIDFLDACLSPDISLIKGVPKAYFFYALKQCINENVINNHYFSKEFLTHYQDLVNYSLYDFEAINTFQETKDPNLAQIKISPELHDYILQDLPANYNVLEKIAYIYIMLCKTLTYDEEFYAVHQHGTVAQKHEDVNNVALITPTHNKVVCYEFNAILAKFFQELGINFETHQTFAEKFGGGHAFLDCRIGKYLLHADSVVTILKGDIASAKFNQPLNGLKAFNRNLETRKEMQDVIKKVYENIAIKEKSAEEHRVMAQITFAQLMQEYRQKSDIKEISFAERFDIFLRKVNGIPQIGIDRLSYLLRIEKILFTIEELDNIINIQIISSKETNDEAVAKGIVIITVNEKGIKGHNDSNLYYLYNPGESIRLITKEELFNKFASGIFEYMIDENIPGISGGGRK